MTKLNLILKNDFLKCNQRFIIAPNISAAGNISVNIVFVSQVRASTYVIFNSAIENLANIINVKENFNFFNHQAKM